MLLNRGSAAAFIVALAVSNAPQASAEVKPHALFSENAVLQRGKTIPVIGTGKEGEKVTVSFRGKQAAGVTKDGRWRVEIDAGAAGGPFPMTIAGENAIRYTNIMVGDIWVCSGQSNMEWALCQSTGGAAAIQASNDTQLRFFSVCHAMADKPQLDLVNGCRPDSRKYWEVSGPGSSRDFSGVGYFFGRELRRNPGVPIGLIHASWGGTQAEAWTSRRALLSSATYKPIIDRSWELKLMPSLTDVSGLPAADRKSIILAAVGQVLYFRIFDRNGKMIVDVNQTKLEESEENKKPIETLKSHVDGLWPPQNLTDSERSRIVYDIITVVGHVLDKYDADTSMYPAIIRNRINLMTKHLEDFVRAEANGDLLPLLENSDELSQALYSPALNPEHPASNPEHPESRDTAASLYNGMIAPLQQLPVRGVIWYQGESNTNPPPRPQQYRALLELLINDWRKGWNQTNLPFLIVQLAPYLGAPGDKEPEDREACGWAWVRQAQLDVSQKVQNTAMVVITDVGEKYDIHPPRKEPVGYRLALAARRVAYGQAVTETGPKFENMQVVGDKARLTFSNTGTGLVAKGGSPLRGFIVKGETGDFVPADARIISSPVLEVSSKEVNKPIAVRFGWADCPDLNLWSGGADGLPASPFATDK